MADPSPFDDFDVPADADAELDGFGHASKSAGVDAAKQAPNAHVFGEVLDEHEAETEHIEAPVMGTEVAEDLSDPFGGAIDQLPSSGQDEFSQQNDPFAHELEQKQDMFSGPTPLSIWEAERKALLEDRARNAKLSKEKAAADAKKDISQFYSQREEALKKTQGVNRTEEKTTKADLERLMKNGTLWEKVARMANVQAGAQGQEGRQARMRKLIIQLKNDKVDENGASKQK